MSISHRTVSRSWHIPVCMLTKQLHTLKTALSTRPEMKQAATKTRSAHDLSTSCARYFLYLDDRLCFPLIESSMLLMGIEVVDSVRRRAYSDCSSEKS